MLQHRVAQFYLRGFTPRAGAPFLYEYQKSVGFVREVSPKEASAELDAFEVDDATAGEFERFFGRVEHFAKQTFVALRSRKQPTALEREYLSVFMALCYVRSSKRSSEADEFCSRVNVDQVSNYLRSTEAKIDYLLRNQVTASQYEREVEDYIARLRAGALQLPLIPRRHELVLVERACSEWARCLESASWSVEIANRTDLFVVPDEPLVTRRKGYPFDPTYVGITRSDLGIETTFPLNRRMCLVLRFQGDDKSVTYKAADSDRVDEINLRSVVCADKLIFAPEQSPRFEKLLQTVGSARVTVQMPAAISELLDQSRKNSTGGNW